MNSFNRSLSSISLFVATFVVCVLYPVSATATPSIDRPLAAETLEQTLVAAHYWLNLGALAIYLSVFAILLVLIGCKVSKILLVLHSGNRSATWTTPLIFLTAFSAPLIGGLTVAMCTWCILLCFMLPDVRRIVTLSAVALGLSCSLSLFLVGVHEQISKPAFLRVTRFAAKPFSKEERIFHINEKGSDLSDNILVLAAQMARRHDDYELFQNLRLKLRERGIAHLPELEVEQAIFAALRGEYGVAEDIMKSIRQGGYETPEVVFLLSRIVFEQDRTREARELVAEARALSVKQVERIEEIEKAFDRSDPRSYTGLSPRWGLLLGESYEEIAKAVQRIWSQDLTRWGALVAALVVIWLRARVSSSELRAYRAKTSNPFHHYHDCFVASILRVMIPGAFQIQRGVVGMSVLLLCVLCAATIPLIVTDTSVLYPQWLEYRAMYGCVIAAAYLAICRHQALKEYS
jgi:hypothetical protein